MRLSLYRRGKIWWARGSLGGEKFRRSTGHSDKGAADLVRRRWEREFADPTHHAAHQATVATAAARFLTELEKSSRSKATWKFYEFKIRHVVQSLGGVRLMDLTHERVMAYVRAREEQGAHSHSIHRELTALRRTLKSASRAGEFLRDWKAIIPEYSAGYEPRTRWLTVEEFGRLCAALETDRAAVVAFIVASSSRWGEMVRTQVEDVGPSTVEIRGTKTKRAKRQVPRLALFERAWVVVDTYIGDRKTGPLFARWTNVRRDLRAACARASVCPACQAPGTWRSTPGCKACAALSMDPVTANDLRRTTATWMVRTGVPFELAAKVLGHASTAMLYRVYGQVDASVLQERIDEITRR